MILCGSCGRGADAVITTTVTHTVTTHAAGHDWVAILSTALPAIVSAGVAIYALRIGRWQAKLQSDKLRVEMFESGLNSGNG